MRLKLIACKAPFRELSYLAALSGNAVEAGDDTHTNAARAGRPADEARRRGGKNGEIPA